MPHVTEVAGGILFWRTGALSKLNAPIANVGATRAIATMTIDNRNGDAGASRATHGDGDDAAKWERATTAASALDVKAPAGEVLKRQAGARASVGGD
jgi:hypothetical protein